MDVKAIVHPVTNTTTYDLVPTQLYLDHPEVFDILENVILMAVIPIFSYTAVVITTSATVVQLKRVIVWRQRASANIDGTEVWCCWVFIVVVENGGGDGDLVAFLAGAPSLLLFILLLSPLLLSPPLLPSCYPFVLVVITDVALVVTRLLSSKILSCQHNTQCYRSST